MGMRNHIVEIRPVENNSGFLDISDIGMFGGVIRWAVGYDATYDASNSAVGFLSRKWISSLNQSAVITRTGNYAATSGGTIGVVSTTKLFNWLTDYDISIYNAVLTVLETSDGGSTYYPIASGVISQKADNIKGGSIPFSDPSKSTATTITKEIDQTGKFYPVNFGRIENAKTASVKANPEIPTTIGAGLVPVWEVYDVEWAYNGGAILYLKTPYIDGVNHGDTVEYFDEINKYAGEIGIKQGDVILPVRLTAVFSGDFWGVLVWLKHGTTKNEETGIVKSTDVDSFASMVPFGINAYDDYFEGIRESDKLTNYDEDKNEFVELPYIRDMEDLELGVTRLTDSDSKGFSKVSVGSITVTANATGIGSVPVNITGSTGNIIDGLDSTYVDITTPVPNHYAVGTLNVNVEFSIRPQQKPEKLIFSSHSAFSGMQSSDVNVSVSGNYKDQFGNSFPLDDNPQFSGVAPHGGGLTANTIDKNCSPVFYNGTTVREWKWRDNSVINIEGVSRVISGDIIPEMVWRTGFNLTMTYTLVAQASRYYDARFRIRQMQFFIEEPFKSDKIYTDISGRKDQDTTSIDTLEGVYKHVLKLQNYSNREYEGSKLETPEGGWGVNYPAVTDWSTFYNESDFASATPIGADFQIMSNINARTDKIKRELCRLLWSIGYTDKNGVERLKPMIDGLYNVDGVLIKYGDLFQGQMPTITDRKYSDVLTDMTFGYGYHTATEENRSSLIIDIADSTILGDMARVLYKSYKVTNKAPISIGDCKWITSQADAIRFATKFYEWQGVYQDDSGVFLAKQRYIAKIKLPYEFVVLNGLEIGTPIQTQIPNQTYWGTVVLNHSGIITAISTDIQSEVPFVTVTAEMLGGDLAGADRILYVETGSADTEIIETGTQNIEISEGEYGD